MKDFKNKILYIIVIVLVIAFMVLIGMVMNLMNRTSNMEKQEIRTSQLTKTSSENAYITTEEHLQELSQIQVSSEDIALKIYPVGSIYISTSETNPSELFGGTWESYGQGRTLVGAGTGTDSNSTSKSFAVNTTGGEYTHTLTIEEMPSHSHTRGNMNITGTITFRKVGPSGRYDISLTPKGAFTKSSFSQSYGALTLDENNTATVSEQIGFNAASSWTGSTSSEGGGQANNNIQPYIVTYMWKRVS